MPLKADVRHNRWYVSGSLLDVNVGNVSGAWQRIEGIFPVAISVEGNFVGTVTLYASSSPTAPNDADANHGALHTFTTPGTYIISAPFEFVKAAVTSYVSGTFSVFGQFVGTSGV